MVARKRPVRSPSGNCAFAQWLSLSLSVTFPLYQRFCVETELTHLTGSTEKFLLGLKRAFCPREWRMIAQVWEGLCEEEVEPSYTSSLIFSELRIKIHKAPVTPTGWSSNPQPQRTKVTLEKPPSHLSVSSTYRIDTLSPDPVTSNFDGFDFESSAWCIKELLYLLEFISDLNEFDSIAALYLVMLGTELLNEAAQMSQWPASLALSCFHVSS